MPRLVDKVLTDAAVRKARSGAARYDLYDARLRGFGLRVATTGTKTWFVMRRVNGRMIRAKVGRYPEISLAQAREKAAGMLAAMSQGENPNTSDGLEFDKVLAEWVERDQAKNRSVNDVRSALAKHVTPKLTGRTLDSIRKHDVLQILDKISDGGAPVQANRVLAYLRRFFNWCVERDLLSGNPAAGIKAPAKEVSRERVLTMDELHAIVNASRRLGYPFGPMVMLLILTGQRLIEVADMTWDEVDVGKASWMLPGSRTKNGRAHVVHLSRASLDVIDALPQVDGQRWLFSTTGKGPVKGFSKAKLRFNKESGVDHWQFHDLRRTFATHATESLGASPVVVDRILNHVSGAVKGVAAVYQRGEYLDERKHVLEAWARFVLAQDDQAGNIVQMRSS